jgi:hypothetical protein
MITPEGKPVRDALGEVARRAENLGYNGTASAIRDLVRILPDTVGEELRRVMRS